MSHLVLDGSGEDAETATQHYLAQLAAERRRKGKLLGQNPDRAGEEDVIRAVAVSSAAALHGLGANWREEAALAKEAQAKARAANEASRQKREARLVRETCATWVGIMVAEAIADSDRRGGVATKLQSSMRGHAARQGMKRMKLAILKMQTVRRGTMARRVMAGMQGRRRDANAWEAKRALELQDNRRKAEDVREARLHAEATARAQEAATRRRRLQEKKLADELIMHACDNDVPLLARTLQAGETVFPVVGAVNVPDDGGWTALMWAASLGHTKVCDLLLKVRADVVRKDSDGWTALMLAVDRDWQSTAELLISAGAQPDAANRWGKSPLTIAHAKNRNNSHAALLDLLRNPPPPPVEEAPATPPRGTPGNRPATAPASGQRPGTAGGSPSRMALRKRPSTAARELAEAVEMMNGIGMDTIGSAGFTTIMRARQLGAATVIRAMIAYAEHHGVQHFGVAALTERLDQRGLTLPGQAEVDDNQAPLVPTAELCSALLLASARHPARKSDVMMPAMHLLSHSFLGPLDGQDLEQYIARRGADIAQSLSHGETAAGLSRLLKWCVEEATFEPDLTVPPHSFVEDCLELLLQALRCDSEAGVRCRPVIVARGGVASLLEIVRIYGLETQASQPRFISMAVSALSLLSMQRQVRYEFEPFSAPCMGTIRRRRRLTLLSAAGLDNAAAAAKAAKGKAARALAEIQERNRPKLAPMCVVWWEGKRVGQSDTVEASTDPRWGSNLEFELPPSGETGTLRAEIWSHDELVCYGTMELGGRDMPGGSEVFLPPFLLDLWADQPPNEKGLVPPPARNGTLTLQVQEDVGTLELLDVICPATLGFGSALMARSMGFADGLQILVDATLGAHTLLHTRSTNGEEYDEDGEQEATNHGHSQSALDVARMRMEVLRLGAAAALGFRLAPALTADIAEEQKQQSMDAGSSSLAVCNHDGLMSMAMATLLPPSSGPWAPVISGLDPSFTSAALSLRSLACLAAMCEGLELVSAQNTASEDVRSLLSPNRVLDGYLSYADPSLAYGHPVCDLGWLLLRRLRPAPGIPHALVEAARQTVIRVTSPIALRVGEVTTGAGEVQARALHSLHWLWLAAARLAAAPGHVFGALARRHLRVHIRACRNLRKMDLVGKNDVYAVVQVGGQTQRTVTVTDGGAAPEWRKEDRCLTFSSAGGDGTADGELSTGEHWPPSKMTVQVLDEDAMSADDLIGSWTTTVPCRSSSDWASPPTWVPLAHHPGGGNSEADKQHLTPAGELQLEAQWEVPEPDRNAYAWGWAVEGGEAIRLVVAVLGLLRGDGLAGSSAAVVGEQQNKACRLLDLMLSEGPLLVRRALVEAVGAGGGILRLIETVNDGTPAVSWAKSYAARALLSAAEVCRDVANERARAVPATSPRTLSASNRLAAARCESAWRAGLLLELDYEDVRHFKPASSTSWHPCQLMVLLLVRPAPTGAADLLGTVGAMQQLAFEHRNGGSSSSDDAENDSPPACAFGVVGCDGRGAGLIMSAADHALTQAWKSLDVKPAELPLVMILRNGREDWRRSGAAPATGWSCAAATSSRRLPDEPPLSANTLYAEVEEQIQRRRGPDVDATHAGVHGGPGELPEENLALENTAVAELEDDPPSETSSDDDE